MLLKIFIRGKIVLLSMFKNKYPIRFEHVAIQDQRRYLGQLFKRIGRIGKDEIKLLSARFEETEHIATNHRHMVVAKLLQTLADESSMVAVGFYADHLTTSSGEQFERDAARTGKKVERRQSLEIEIAIQHIEDVFFGKIGGRTRFERAWNIKMPSLVFSCNNPHNNNTCLNDFLGVAN